MTRALLLLALLVAACATPRAHAEAAASAEGTTFAWSDFIVPADATDGSYEVRVWSAEQGLPREEVLRAEGVSATAWRTTTRLGRGAYVWSVRATYLRAGRRCVSPWFGAGRSSIVPPRGLPRLEVE